MKPTERIVAACRQALDWHQEYSDRRSLCEQWMVTFARTVATNKRPATIMRVNRWFESHENLRSSDGFFATTDPTSERISWEMLGGDEGKAWAQAYVRNHNDEDEASVGDDLVELDNDADAREADETPPLTSLADRQLPSFQHRPLVAGDYANTATFNEFDGRRPEWAGVLTLEEVETSDMRIIRAGALTWRDLPITLQDQLLSQGGHDGAVAAGPITNIFRVGQEIRGEGFFDSGDDGQNARRRMSEGTKQGVSVDLTEVELDLPDDPDELMDILMGEGLLVIIGARIGAATLVSIPAFEGARLQIIGDLDEEVVTPDALVASGGMLPAGVTLKVVVPIEAVMAGFVASGDDGSASPVEQLQWISISELAPGSYPDETGDAIAPHLVEIPTETDTELAEHIEASSIESRNPHLVWFEQTVANDGDTGIRTAVGWRAVDGQAGTAEALAATYSELYPITEPVPLVASAGAAPPPEWFAREDYVGPTPFKISEPNERGFRQLHGHIAVWGSCHIGFSGRCVDVPRGLSYDSFQGPQVPCEVRCSDGSTVKAGPFVMDTVHPSLKANASDSSAHYADTGSLVAQGCLYEDQFGLQARAWILPGVTDEQIARLNAADMSPDWRPRATANGGRGVVAVLAVPVSGFNLGLVASGGPDQLDDGLTPVEDMGIVGTNWTPQLSALARRQMSALQRCDAPVPQHIALMAAQVEAPALTARKSAVLARLSGDVCECGGACCSR